MLLKHPVGVGLDLVAASGPEDDYVDPRLTGAERADELWRVQTRRRWSALTKDLASYCREWAGPQELGSDEEETRQTYRDQLCTLDVPCAELDGELEPLRQSLLKQVHQQLSRYDTSEAFRDRQDEEFACRDIFEEHVRSDAVRRLRQVVQRHCHGLGSRSISANSRPGNSLAAPQKDLGQVWQVLGGKKEGGIIVRGDFPSPKVIGRLSTNALVEQMAVTGDRLQYRLLDGTGPATGWVSVVLKANGEEKPLLSKVPPGQAKLQVEALRKSNPRASVLVIGLMAVHISKEVRLQRLKHVLGSVGRQDVPQSSAEFVFAVSWSASSPELETRTHDVIEELKRAHRSGIQVVAIRQQKRHSQFQHLKAALNAAEDHLRHGLLPMEGDQVWDSAWVIFGDDDDIWHKRRVAEYIHAIRMHSMLDGVAAFVTMTRVNCHAEKAISESELPCTEEDVDSFLRKGRGQRMDSEPPALAWRRECARQDLQAGARAMPADLGLEYFDFCPRLRVVREFLARTPPRLLEHKYCDLHLTEFLSSYPRMGRELGLEVALFQPRCWMLFYATPVASVKQWERTVEKLDGTAADPQQQLQLDVNGGHMSTSLEVQPAEQELSERMCEEFREYEPRMTAERLARYWAAFRNALEVFLVRKHGQTIDQRQHDLFVFLAINSSFFKFADLLERMTDRAKAETAERMMYYVGQGFGRAVAARLGIRVLWVRPDIFLGRDFFYSMEGMAVPLLGLNATNKKVHQQQLKM
mmetsp:Transcript_24045/g.68913  ORF Transcript_24045/g.68913 Transcript_24045/m.68913 type:complete len:752 (+) Transcript_24045:86-2341(+)